MAQHRYSNIPGNPFNTRFSQEEEPFLEPTLNTHDHRAGNIHLANIEEKKRLWWRNAIINASYILCWFFFATILSVYNKWMFSTTRYAFPAPLFVTTMHMFMQFTLAAILRFTWPAHFRPARVPTRADYGKKAVPTAVATSLDIGLSNLSLKTITLSFYTMCKSSSLIFVLLFAFLLRLETFSWRLVAVIFLIFSGVLLMVATETHFILDGFLLVISASALGGLRWSLTQIMLKNKKMGFDNPAATIYWLAPIMGVSLAITSLATEDWVNLFQSKFFSGFSKILETLFFLSAPGIIAFCMVLSEFYILQRTGVVPMSIAGIAKEVTTISVSSWIFGDQLTPLNIIGVSTTVCGIALFTFHKYHKSLDSNVPLDVHGNPVTDDDDDVDFTEGETRPVAEEDIGLASERNDDDEFREVIMSRNGESQVLFSADDGDEDADELRSIRSSKFRWKPYSNKEPSVSDARLEEAGVIVARESIELERMWARDQT